MELILAEIMKDTRLDSEEDELSREKSRIYESAIETCRKAMHHKEVPKRKATGKLAELVEEIKKKEASMSEEDRWMQMYIMGYNDAIAASLIRQKTFSCPDKAGDNVTLEDMRK